MLKLTVELIFGLGPVALGCVLIGYSFPVLPSVKLLTLKVINAFYIMKGNLTAAQLSVHADKQCMFLIC